MQICSFLFYSVPWHPMLLKDCFEAPTIDLQYSIQCIHLLTTTKTLAVATPVTNLPESD